MVNQDESLIRIPPYNYIHVLNQNDNVCRLEIGPLTYVRQDNEKIVRTPTSMINVPPGHYCIIRNPAEKDAQGRVVFEKSGQAKLRHEQLEVVLSGKPFPLHPGEMLQKPITALQNVVADSCLRLRAKLGFIDRCGTKRVAGDEWLFIGPGTYIPQLEADVVETIKATVIKKNQAITLRARSDCVSIDGQARVTGELWTVSRVGAYLPAAFEEVVNVVSARVLTEHIALMLRANRTFIDQFKKERKSGEEWLVTSKDCTSYIESVHESLVGVVNITSLNNRQYCVILDPVVDGKPLYGQKKLIKGEASFFLQPGERLEDGIQDVYVLDANEGLLCRATETFLDGDVRRQAGDVWMVRGPTEYIPEVQGKVVETRRSIPLDDTEGIYVRDVHSGKVRLVRGENYLLNENEELWSKKQEPQIEALINDKLRDREPWRAVTYNVPHNSVVQVYNYKNKMAHFEIGPALVMLEPDESLTRVSLSGGKPKQPNKINCLHILLGPGFFSDHVTIETADHARLVLQLSYNWHYDINFKDPRQVAKIFSVPDFIGDACKTIASRIRGTVASVTFDDFHKNSADIIRTAFFGPEDKPYLFPNNRLVITSIDIKSVDPVDIQTRDMLQQSVQLAIEITTDALKKKAHHDAQRLEQEAKGAMQRQNLNDQSNAENYRRQLLQLRADTRSVESTGKARAEAAAIAEANAIEGQAAVDAATMRAEGEQITSDAEIMRLTRARELQTFHTREMDSMDIQQADAMGELEVLKFQEMVRAIGADTIASIARAGPEMQAKLLSGLGIKTTLITDGKSPINLFNTAQGMVTNPSQA